MASDDVSDNSHAGLASNIGDDIVELHKHELKNDVFDLQKTPERADTYVEDLRERHTDIMNLTMNKILRKKVQPEGGKAPIIDLLQAAWAKFTTREVTLRRPAGKCWHHGKGR
ncbi:hypothetical protein MJD09_06595 [bacterium]|nr:hypothetical protein [bacterium]